MSKSLTGCLVFLCVLSFVEQKSVAYDIGGRWTNTQLDGGGIQRGDSVSLRWSVVPDGESYDRSSNSQLIAFLDDGWNVPLAEQSPSLTNRPWWSVMNAAYEQYERVSGLRMFYVREQNSNGSDSGLEGDLRIGGEAFAGGALADNVYPNGGDMRINLIYDDEGVPSTYFTDTTRLQNLISHESGHGVGLGHNVSITGAESVMETFIQDHFLGLQFDDIYAFNRNYGDPYEKASNNDAFASGYNLGTFSSHSSVALGTDAADASVDVFDSDWLGIDGSTDVDWFRFTVPQAAVVGLNVTPQGPTYTTGNQGLFDAAAQSNLRFEVYDSNLSLIRTENKNGIGGAEKVSALSLFDAGEYYVRVVGEEDENQFYRIDVNVDLPELKLKVNRATGGVYLSGITSNGVDIDGYSITSTSGGINAGPGVWKSFASEGEADWEETNHTNQALFEYQATGVKHVDLNDSIYLGDVYQPVYTAQFGTLQDEDFDFSYTGPGLGADEISGLVEFVGDPLYNNLVLSVDPVTGEATLSNESQTAIDLNGYFIKSASGALTPDSWVSLDDQELDAWRESNPTENSINELEPGAGTQLSPFESLFLGKLFDAEGIQDLSLSFLLANVPAGWLGEDPLDWEGVVVYEFSADFDSDGDVDSDDLTDATLGWESRYGNDLDGSDFLSWQRQFGGASNSSLASSQAVPEPGTLASLFVASLLGAVRRFQKVKAAI